MKRLLVVSHRPMTFGGGGSVRWRFLERDLPQRGWEVRFVTANANVTSNESSSDPYRARLARLRARITGTIGTRARRAYGLAGVRPEAFPPSFAWALSGRRRVFAAVRSYEPHVVWSTCPPHVALFLGAAAARAHAVPFVAEFRDLWAGNPYFDAGGGLLTRLEARPLAHADAVVTVTPGCREVVTALHPELEARLRMLPNGFDPRLLGMRNGPSPRRSAQVTLVHAGTLYGDRSAAPLIRALRRSGLEARVRVELLGTVDPDTTALLAQDHRMRVSVAPFASWEEAIERTRTADIAVVINGEGTGGEMALPSKLYEALALGRPVLALTPAGSDTELLLRSLGLGDGVAPPRDEDRIAAAVARLIDAPPAPASYEQLRDFDRSVVAGEIAKLLDAVAR